MSGNELQTLIWALMALILAGGAAVAARRRPDGTKAGGPGVLLSLVWWAAIFAVAMVIAQGAEFWGRLASFFR